MPVDSVRPATDWLFNIASYDARSIILKRFNQIRGGNLGDHKSLGYDLFEFRVFYQTGYRIYYIQNTPTQKILLCAGSKNTQRRDIDRARALQQIVKQTQDPQYCSYKRIIRSFISSNQGALSYIQAHQRMLENEPLTFEMIPVMLKDFISVYGYVQIAEMLGLAPRVLFANLMDPYALNLAMVDRLKQAFDFYQQDMRIVANQ